jgi:hypothetical protein
VASLKPEHLQAAVSRLTGDTNPHGAHVSLYRLKVTGRTPTGAGKPCGIAIRIGKKKAYKTNLTQIADRLCMEVEELKAWKVLETWQPEDTRRYLEQFSADILDSLAHERRFREVPAEERARYARRP